jgi:hypothetical protein
MNVAYRGYKTLSLVKDGVNFCENDLGCSVYFSNYQVATPGRAAGDSSFNAADLFFRQIDRSGSHQWYFSYGNRIGINGDSTSVTLANHSAGYLYDDLSGIETSPDYLTVYDNSSIEGYIVSVCSF